MRIPFNKPFLSGKELEYIGQAVASGKISGNGTYTKKCHSFFELRYGIHKCLLTTSCTDALEMTAMLMNIGPGDEVIVPSYTFVSTALAFVRQGAKIVFADSRKDHPGIDEDLLEALITPATKAVVVVHYAGVATDMNKIVSLAKKHSLYIVEDAAQAIDSTLNGRPLGTYGDFGVFSFHETKNIISGEGGLLAINNPDFAQRAEILWEKGTDRARFFRGEIDKYGWVDTGSSFLPSEIIAAFLFAQLENLDSIQSRRKEIWNSYDQLLRPCLSQKQVGLPVIPDGNSHNAHMYYLVCRSAREQDLLIETLKQNQILAVFHYQSLHKSPFYTGQHDGRSLPESDRYSDCLVRLPLYYELKLSEVSEISKLIVSLFE
jgi:dTDP-4-amino-4,6-dideoxygalactose transaminase